MELTDPDIGVTAPAVCRYHNSDINYRCRDAARWLVVVVGQYGPGVVPSCQAHLLTIWIPEGGGPLLPVTGEVLGPYNPPHMLDGIE